MIMDYDYGLWLWIMITDYDYGLWLWIVIKSESVLESNNNYVQIILGEQG